MKILNVLKKLTSVLLAAVMIMTMMPAAIYADAGQGEKIKEIPEAVIPVVKDEEGEIKEEDDWIATYPYGTFAFGDFQSDVAEYGAVNEEGKLIPSSIRIPVYRVGGTSGRVTAKITYAPAVTMTPDGSGYMYDYAASGKTDLVIRYENPKAIAKYQEIGMPNGLKNMEPSKEGIVFDDPGEGVQPEDDLVLMISGEINADSYQWQAKSTLGWANVRGATDSTFTAAWEDVWDFDTDSPAGMDYRCIYVVGGQYYCTESLLGDVYEKIAPIPEAPEDLPLDEEPTYSVLEFEDDFDVYEFDLTFADGETVKYIEIDAIDDDTPELPEMGIFTIAECEGGELSDLCNTHTVLVSDNDEAGISEIGFEVADYRVDRSSGKALVKVIRKGDTSYNVTVDYETEDGTAKEGVDYAKASGTVALVGSINEIEIPIDLIANGDTQTKTFKVKLSSVKGGGTDHLCSIKRDETTVTLVGVMSAEERAGLNLATVLAGSDGEDLTSRVVVEEKSLIGDTTTLDWNYEGSKTSDELKGEYTVHPATRSHLAWAGLTFSRSSVSSDYKSGDYWCDSEQMVGIDHYGLPQTSDSGVNTMRYLEGMEPTLFTMDGVVPEGVVTSGSYITGPVEGAYKVWVKESDIKGHYEEASLEYYQLASNFSSRAGMTIEHAGLLFKDFHFAFKIENYGKKGKSSYYYPRIWFDYNDRYFDSRFEQSYGLLDGVKINVHSADIYTVGWVLSFDYNPYVETDGATWSYTSGDSEFALQHNEGVWDPGDEHNMGINLYTTHRSTVSELLFGDTDFSFGIDFDNIKQYDQNYTPKDSPEIADSQTIVDVVNFNFERRAFAYKNGTVNEYEIEQEDPMVLPVVIYTANDDDEVQGGWSPIDLSTEYGEALYGRLAPEVTIAKKRGGVTRFGSLYVGSTLVLDCGKQAGYTVPDKGVYLTRSDGKIVAYGTPVNDPDRPGIWELTFLWSDMTEEDLSDTYQINVIYERTQTLSLDISPSVPRLDGMNIDPSSVPSAWRDFFGYDEKTGICSKKITIEYGIVDSKQSSDTASGISGYTDEGDPVYVDYVDYTDFISAEAELTIGDFTDSGRAGMFDSKDLIRNAQAICFGQDENDTILFNNHSYKGNEFIPLGSDDVASQNLTFYFYDHAYTGAMSTMVANLDHAELYYDGDGGGISGTFVNGIFIPSGEDVYVGQIKGEHFEQEFAPFIDEDDVLHQYYIKAIYSMRPRALEKPEGSIGELTAQVFPVFLSAVTDPDEEDGLTREQKAYRYVGGTNVDGHPMYAEEATALSYIDIPLGGDISKVRRYSVTTGIYDTSGEKLIDSVNTTEYIWEPDYIGALKVPFEYPLPIEDRDNITQKTVLYAGEVSVYDEATGIYYHSEEGVRKLNEYLGAFAGRSTFGVCVQVQQQAYEDIKDLADIAPESIDIADISSVPNANNVINFESAENKDETQGQTPDGTGFNEFGGDLGIDLPSLEFGIGDYATLVLDGNQIGLSVGLPLVKAESTSYGSDNTTTNADGSKVETYKEDGADIKKTTKADGSVETERTTVDDDVAHNKKTVTRRVETVDADGNKTYYNETKTYETAPGKEDRHMATIIDTNAPPTPQPNKSNAFSEANGQMVTLGKFIASVVKQAGGEKGAVSGFMKGAFEDDTLKQAKNGRSTSRKFSFSLAVQLALTFEYNPVYNTHVFKEGALSACVSFEFTLQHRFTPVPLVYVYVKTGVGVELGVGMGMLYTLEEGDTITSFETGDLNSLGTKNGKLIFKLDDSYSGFHATFNGKLYMEVFDHMPKDGDKAMTAGIISSSGGTKEVLLTQYSDDLYIKLTSVSDKVTMMSVKPIIKSSKAYFNGAFITPSISIEAGVGIGIELLKFELFVKTNLAITATFGQYIPEEDEYEPAYMSNFDWNISVGFNIVILFINYSMDLVAFSVEGEQDGTSGNYTWNITASSVNGMKVLWTEIRYTDAHGKPIPGPKSGMRAISEGGEVKSPAANGQGLIKISSPTDVSATQKINAVRTTAEELQKLMRGETEEMRAFPATGTDAFQLSGYGTSGDARILAEGLTTGYTYKLFAAGDENYIIYPRMIDGAAQLVMSKVIMAGDLAVGTGLQNPVSPTAEEPYIVLDGDGLADYDFSVDAEGNTVTALWTTDGEKGIVTKRASITLGEDSAFEKAALLTADDGRYRYLTDQTGDMSIFAESAGTEGEKKAAKLAYRSYLIARNPALVGDDYDLLEDGDTSNPILVSAVYSYVTTSKMIDMQGTSTMLSAVIQGDDALKTAFIKGEVIENIETVRLGDKTVAAYTTSKTAYFDSVKGTTVDADAMDGNTERALIRRLYIREISEDGFGEAKLIQEVVDFENCDASNLDSAILKDGVYVSNALYGTGESDPHYANLRFLTAALELSEDPETFLLFEMGSNTYIMRQADILSLLGGSTAPARLTPVFESTQGTDVTIGSDGRKLAAVYTAAMPNSLNNAIWIAWWDVNAGTWGEPNVLAMRDLQVYEDSIIYEMSPEETELAYLGKAVTPAGNSGSMSRLYFTDLQMSTREVYEAGETRQELIVLTEGSIIDLQDFEYEKSSGEKVSTVIPKRVQSEENEEVTKEVPPNVGFYAIAFGEGKQALGEGTLGFANYDFTSGRELVGEVNFRNVGTSAIRASRDNPVTVILTVSRPGEGSQELAKWLLSDTIPAGGKVRLTFTTDPLTQSLPTGSKFSLYLTEDAEYIEEMYHGEAFSGTISDLFEVEKKAELTFGDFDAQFRSIDDGYAVIYIESSVLNVGNKDADEVFIQFTYDKGREDENGVRYIPIDLEGNTLKTGKPEPASRKLTANEKIGVYMLKDEDGGTFIAKGYKRSVYGSIRVPLDAFIKGDSLSGLHLRAEVFSSDDEPDLINSVYASQHEEYNQDNNLVVKTVNNVTVFSVPSQVPLSLGNTLRLPVPYTTTAEEADIVVTEIGSGAENWRSLLGILYYDSSTNTIVAAANEVAEEMIEQGLVPTGIIQVKDTATNSIAAIAFRITESGDGVNIFKDDKSFEFHNADGSVTDTDAEAGKGQDWYFATNVPADGWKGGETENEVPMNGDLSRATKKNAYVEFLTTADTMKIYFSGKIRVQQGLFDEGQVFSKSPAELDFDNKEGLTYVIKVTALEKDTEIDRYTATYEVSPVVLRDEDAPQILWNRSFPETASLKPGTEVPMRCYIVDNGGISRVTFRGKELTDKTDPKIEKADSGFWYFDYTFTKNDKYEVVTYDTVGNDSKMIVDAHWYNAIVSGSAVADAPDFVPGDLYFVNNEGDSVLSEILTEAPWLYSKYKPLEGEESSVYLFLDGDFEEIKLEKGDNEEKWKIVSNGYYMVKVDREDGAWARVIIMMNRLDVDEPQISVNVDGSVISYTIADDKSIASLTINGQPIDVSGNPFSSTYEPYLGGSYTIEVTDDAGNVTRETVDVSIDLEVPEDAVDMSIIYDGKLIGTVTIDPEKIIGGQYDETVSDPAQGEYKALYYFAVVPKGTDPADIKNEDFASLKDGTASITDIFDGEYDIYVKDSKGHTVKYDESFHVYHPDDQWKNPVYSWAGDYSFVTASRQSKLYFNYIQSETQWSVSWTSKSPSCEGRGETTYMASFASKYFYPQSVTVANIAPLGHEWGEWTVVKKPTDNDPGEEERVCSRDKTHVEKRSIPALGAPSYSIDKGVKAQWKPGDGSLPIVVSIDREDERALKRFKSLFIDGKEVGESAYSLDVKNSTVYIKEEFLKKLKRGDHEVKIVFTDGSIATSFTVVKAPSWVPWTCGALGLALAAFLAWFLLKKRKEDKENN